MKELMASLRQMRPTEKKPNSKVLQDHRGSLNDMWKNVSSEELREMLSQSISDQQFGGQRTQKMNEWLKQLQQGNSDMLQQQMDRPRKPWKPCWKPKRPKIARNWRHNCDAAAGSEEVLVGESRFAGTRKCSQSGTESPGSTRRQKAKWTKPPAKKKCRWLRKLLKPCVNPWNCRKQNCRSWLDRPKK